jgi:hypothetical protein
MHSNEIAKTTLKEMKPEEAAKTVFEKKLLIIQALGSN